MAQITNKGHTVDTVYLDFVRTFCSLNHRLSLEKLATIGFVDVVNLHGQVAKVDVDVYIFGCRSPKWGYARFRDRSTGVLAVC